MTHEAWTSHNFNVDHFWVFGSLVHIKNIRVNLKNLDDHNKAMIFIKYDKGTKRLEHMIQSQEIFISRDIVFEEDSQWDQSESNVEKNLRAFSSLIFFDFDIEHVNGSVDTTPVQTLKDNIEEERDESQQLTFEDSGPRYKNIDQIYIDFHQYNISERGVERWSLENGHE